MARANAAKDEIDASGRSLTGEQHLWRHSLLGKLVIFLLVAVLFAYMAGAAAGLVMLERGSREQWWRQAELNAQVTSSAIRGIYTFVAVNTDPSGQVVSIVTDRPIGDEESVLATGFAPADVLALASAQTKQNVWLLYMSPEAGLVAIADALGLLPAEYLNTTNERQWSLPL